MSFVRQWRIWGVLLLLALVFFWPGRASQAAEIPVPVRTRLEQVDQMRRDGLSEEAAKLLTDYGKEVRQDKVAHAAVQFVLADIKRQDLKDEKGAVALYNQLAMTQIEGEVEIPGFGTVDIQDSALQVQDQRNQSHWLYKMMAGIVYALAHIPVIGKVLQPHTGVLAILLLSIVIKLALTPLTKKSFRSMREMQKLQPLMKDLQQRYRDKPQELQKRTMELYQEHGVNPLSGCLPMLLQMPIIILLWRAIALYQYPLSKESFLWIKSLAVADVPLAFIYAASLYASSKLTMMPSADPSQEQQQKMMAIMMPVMFFFLFKSYPAGFFLGWFFFNVLTTAQQWHLMRCSNDEATPGTGSGPGSGPGSSGGGNGGGGNGGGSRRPAGPNGGAPRGKAKSTSSRTINKRKKHVAAYHRGR